MINYMFRALLITLHIIQLILKLAKLYCCETHKNVHDNTELYKTKLKYMNTLPPNLIHALHELKNRS